MSQNELPMRDRIYKKQVGIYPNIYLQETYFDLSSSGEQTFFTHPYVYIIFMREILVY